MPHVSSEAGLAKQQQYLANGSESLSGSTRKPRRRALFYGGGALLAVLPGAAAWAKLEYDNHWKYEVSTDDALIQADQVTISLKLSGYVRNVNVRDDQPVGKGAALVQLDPADFATKVRSADAGIASAEFAQQAAVAQQAEARAQIGQARADLAAAQTALRFASGEVQRYKPLVKSGAEAAGTLAQLTVNRDRAAADVAARQAALTSSASHVATLGAQTRELAAQTATARMARTAAYNDLSAVRLSAPVAGRIASRSVRVGQFVQPGMRLMTIVPDGELYVIANFKETQVGLMRPGLPAKIRVDALPGITFAGTVASVSPGTGANFSLMPPENATGNFTKIVQRVPVRIRIGPGPMARRVLVPGAIR